MNLSDAYQPFAKMEPFETIEVNATLAMGINQRLQWFYTELNLHDQRWLRTSLHLLASVGVGGAGSQSVHPDTLRYSTDRAAELMASWLETDKNRFAATPLVEADAYGVREPLGFLPPTVYTKDAAIALAQTLNDARDARGKPPEPAAPQAEVFETRPTP